ncbi:hypothetical protein SME04J_04520 [Serratia marcescens]|nr:hypothetical protein SME04J_04520 [Serratia marcescens]
MILRAALLLLRLATLHLPSAVTGSERNAWHFSSNNRVKQSADLVEITTAIWEEFLHYRNSCIFLI